MWRWIQRCDSIHFLTIFAALILVNLHGHSEHPGGSAIRHGWPFHFLYRYPLTSITTELYAPTE